MLKARIKHHPNICKILLSTFSFIILLANLALGEIITVNYDFPRPEIVDIRIGDQDYQKIIMPNSPTGGLPGQPALPSHGAYILIPYANEVESIEINLSEQIYLGGGFNIQPVGQPYPLSASADQIKLPTPDPQIYGSSAIFPAERYANMGTQTQRGYDILVLKLKPVEYNPKAGDLFYYENIEIKVHTTATGKSSSFLRGFQEDLALVASRVDNPQILDSYSAAGKSHSRNYDLLILTNPFYATAFQALKDYHDSTGIATEIHTTDQVGSTDPSAVREYIAQRYLNDGIQFVIIGGDDDIIPALDLYVESWPGSGNYIDYNMPGDIYFGCLDGTYNYDGDSYWGEPTDGEGGSDVDMLGEVYVGRFSAGSTSEIYNVINKTIQYRESQGAYLNNVVMLGENLSFGGLGEYGGYALDEIIDQSDSHGYTTQGIPSSVYNIEKIYDLNWIGNDWPATELATRVNSGLHIINHYGHCNTGWALKMNLTNVIMMWSNENRFFLYSQGCYAGAFDDECWAEICHSTVSHGAFAVIMNARYGFGDYGTDGPSQRYDREFFDAIYSDIENKNQLGPANQDSKEDNLYRIDESCMRWCTYQLNLFGDPTLSIKTWGGLTFDYPSGIPGNVQPGENVSFDLEVDGVCGGVPIENSAQIHYQIGNQEEQSAALTQTGPNHYAVDLPAISCGDILTFYFSAEELIRGIFYDTEPDDPHTVFPCEQITNLFEDDFESDLGWTVSDPVWERGVPQGLGGYDLQYGVPDPDNGYDGPNVYGYNLAGDYENNITEKYLTSPAIDCSSASRVYLSFMRWLGVQNPDADKASVEISTDGSTWNLVWQNPAIIADNFWMEIDMDITSYAAAEKTVYLRWVMGPTNYNMRYCGWNIDAVKVYSYDCSSYLCGDASGDGSINVSDAVYIINFVFMGASAPEPYEAGDVNCDATVNVSDAVYIINYVFSNGDAPCDTDGDQVPDCR